jgi:hypothetical protein
LTVAAIKAQEKGPQAEMAQVAAQLAGLSHETMILRGVEVWPTVKQAMENCSADLIVLGTHGRTGAQKFLLGSVAEEIFRRSSVPLSIYPLTATEMQLDFSGLYEPPFGAVGKTINVIVGHRIAKVSVHRFISDVAGYLRQALA